jgi:hypothetical protein
MKLVITKSAANHIEEAKEWVEGKNTEGAGQRWYDKILLDLQQRAKSGVKHAICKNEKLARRQFRCFTYNDRWVVAYKIDGDKFVVYRFILGAKLQ